MRQETDSIDPSPPIRVLLADRRRLYCSGLRKVLEDTGDIRVVGEAHDLAEAQRMAGDLMPGVMVLAALAPFSRLGEVISDIRSQRSELAILVLAASDEPPHLPMLWAAGAMGVIDEMASPEVLVTAIRRANRGELVFSREQIVSAQCQAEEVSKRWMDLTQRERQVLRLIAEGKSNAAVARELHIAEKTAEHHAGRILAKLGVSTRVEAALWAIKAEVVRL